MVVMLAQAPLKHVFMYTAREIDNGIVYLGFIETTVGYSFIHKKR